MKRARNVDTGASGTSVTGRILGIDYAGRLPDSLEQIEMVKQPRSVRKCVRSGMRRKQTKREASNQRRTQMPNIYNSRVQVILQGVTNKIIKHIREVAGRESVVSKARSMRHALAAHDGTEGVTEGRRRARCEDSRYKGCASLHAHVCAGPALRLCHCHHACLDRAATHFPKIARPSCESDRQRDGNVVRR
jgi:hypothetical protein